MSTDDQRFFSVALNTSEANACSPADPGPNWRGILIQAPQVIILKREPDSLRAKPLAPICGLYTIEMARLLDGVPMLVRATERVSGKTYTGVVLDADPSPQAPLPNDLPVDPATLKGLVTSSYFTRNLFDFLALPQRAAVYEVQIELGGMRSNKVVIEVSEAR